MKSNDDVQAALITYLKAQSALLVKLASTGEVREDQWQGTDFAYPALRVALSLQTKLACGSRLTFSILVFSEKATSREADDIAGDVSALLDGKNFTRSGVRFAGIASAGLVPAQHTGTNLWKAEARFTSILD